MDTFTNFEQTDWWKESQLIPHFGFIIEWFFQQLQASSSFLTQRLINKEHKMCGIVGIVSQSPVNESIYAALTLCNIVDKMRQVL